jgi:hypothetical protein
MARHIADTKPMFEEPPRHNFAVGVAGRYDTALYIVEKETA